MCAGECVLNAVQIHCRPWLVRLPPSQYTKCVTFEDWLLCTAQNTLEVCPSCLLPLSAESVVRRYHGWLSPSPAEGLFELFPVRKAALNTGVFAFLQTYVSISVG